jgi:flagellar export protein FliJ
MKRFVWRLQTVLDIKTKEEEARRAELLAIIEKLAQTQSELLRQKRILEDIISDITGIKSKERLRKQEFFLKCSETNNKLIKKLKNKVSELKLEQRKKIAEVIKARRLKEGLERLREEAKKQFIKEQEKLEQKELDEGATISFSRKKLMLK